MKIKISFQEIFIEMDRPTYTQSAIKVQPNPKWLPFLFAAVAFFSFAAWGYYYHLGLTLAYNDARSHLVIARRVIESLQPGMAQFGSVWLPMLHMLEVLTVWNDTMFRTGLSGGIVSMLSYIAGSIFLWRIVKRLGLTNSAAVVALLIFVFNPNMVYMQTTAMTESLTLLLIIAVTYFFLEWMITERIIYLVFGGIAIFVAILTRYDGWFLYLVACGLIAGVALWKHGYKRAEGDVMLFGICGFFAIALWILWNTLIFNDPLFFSRGGFSAKVQQDLLEQAGRLPAKGDMFLSFYTFLFATIENVGLSVFLIAVVGMISIFTFRKKAIFWLTLFLLSSPFFFNIISLYKGHSVLHLPYLPPYAYFNDRYGLLMLPFVAVAASILANWKKFLAVVLSIIVIAQFTYMQTTNNVITIRDGVSGASGYFLDDIGKWLNQNAREGLILVAASSHDALLFVSGLPMTHFITEGMAKYWKESLGDPTKHAEYVIMHDGDLVWEKLHGNPLFENNYEMVYDGEFSDVFKRKPQIQTVPEKPSTPSAAVQKKLEKFVGVNAYDLVYLPKREMEETVRKAKDSGVGVIRFWAFGEGLTEGFQPKEGEYNMDTFDKLAYVLSVLESHDIQGIVTLGNYWKDYGGVPQYLEWEDLDTDNPDVFFTNEDTKKQYKAFVEKVLNYESAYTKKKLHEDPAILAWELMNEPRSVKAADSQAAVSWISEMAGFIKSIDKTHMVFAGTEGFSDLYNAGGNGPSFAEIADLPEIDAATGHYYAEWNTRGATLSDIITDWATQAKEAGKPFIFEEIGFDKRKEKNKGVERIESYKELFADIEELNVSGEVDVDGLLLWNWSLKKDDSYGISPNDPIDSEIIKLF